MTGSRTGDGESSEPLAPRVVFLRGVTPRTGTNYVRDLLLLHPEIRRARTPIWEDFTLDDAPLLRRYSRSLGSRWPESWQVPTARVDEELGRAFGQALTDVVIGAERGGTTVAKTPSVANLDLFRWLFPDDVLVLLVRDGRSVVESLTRSFGWSVHRAQSTWARGAREVQEFTEAHADGRDRWWTLLRYEDVLAEPVAAVDRVARLSHLGVGLVGRDAAEALPVRGSSQRAAEEGGLHWRPVARDAGFDPASRWTAWDADRHARFNLAAGREMRHFGYELVDDVPVGVRDRVRLAGREIGEIVTDGPTLARRMMGRRRQQREP